MTRSPYFHVLQMLQRNKNVEAPRIHEPMLEILWSVVDSQLASSDPLRAAYGPAPGPACGRAKVVIGYP